MSPTNVIQLPVRELNRLPARPSGELTIEEIRKADAPVALPGGKKTPHRYLFCPVQKGFGVAISVTGARTYFVQARVNGKVQRRTLDSVDAISIKEARRRARELRAEATLDGKDISKRVEIAAANPEPALTLAGAWTQFQKERELSPKTVLLYSQAMERLAAWHDRDLWSITKADVARRFQQVLDQYKKTAASQTFRFLRTLWNYHAAELPVSPVSPTCVLKRRWPKQTRKTRLIDDKHFPAWWSSLDGTAAYRGNGSAWALYFKALALTGCRRMELLRAEWTWYDAKRRELWIPGPVTKNRKPHKIPVGPKLAAMLVEHRATQEERESRFIFATRGGGRLAHPGNVVARHRKAHGVDWSPHDLRRTYLTVADAINVPRGVQKALVNHSSGDVTEGYIRPEDLRTHQERIEAAICKRAKVRS